MDLAAGGKSLKNIGQLNVIIGKNGTGKSQILRHFDQHLRNEPGRYLVKYLSPERGGNLTFDAGVENNLQTNATWGADTRRRNRVDNFRQMSFAEFRLLETLVLRSIETDLIKRADNSFTFSTTVELINALLDSVKLVRTASTGFEVHPKVGAGKRNPDSLSSGESELLCIAIEILSFAYQAKHPDNQGRQGVLLLDEPDVHLHPDLQHRLMELLVSATADTQVVTLIATHSTAILGGLSATDASVVFMRKDAAELGFRSVSDALRQILPVFGAHPLSNVFNQNPILLVEGDDDVRIWQQAVRSSSGRIKLWPCPAGDKQSLNQHETTAAEIIGSVYDNARAYSLRDKDDQPYGIDDLEHVTRMRLSCRTAENLLLSDDVLATLGTDWNGLKQAIQAWLEADANRGHPRFADTQTFSAADDRKGASVKPIRNVLLALTGYEHAWEVAVGKTIAGLTAGSPQGDGSLIDFLGPKAVRSLLGITVKNQDATTPRAGADLAAAI